MITAIAFSQSRLLERTLYPYAVILQVTPVVAIAPLIVIWVGFERINLALLILAWIVAHAGVPEVTAPAAPARGLYGSGFGGGVTAPRGPSRYVLPAAALVV